MSFSYPDTEEEYLGLMPVLINKMQDRREAVRVGEEFLGRKGPFNSAHSYFQLALAYLLLNNAEKHREHWDSAKNCLDYTAEIEGDFYRDLAQHHARFGELELAESMIERSITLHKDSPVKIPADLLAKAKLRIIMKNYSAAYVLFDEAERMIIEQASLGMDWQKQHLLNLNWWTLLVAARTKNTAIFDQYYDRLINGFNIQLPEGAEQVVEDIAQRRQLARVMKPIHPQLRAIIARGLV